MTLPQILFGIYFAFLGAYLSVLMGRILKQNGRVLEKIDETIKKIDETTKMLAKLIVEENERTRKEILDALTKSK